jgi:hypothetical protein
MWMQKIIMLLHKLFEKIPLHFQGLIMDKAFMSWTIMLGGGIEFKFVINSWAHKKNFSCEFSQLFVKKRLN